MAGLTEIARLARSLRKLLEDVQAQSSSRRVRDAIALAKQIEAISKSAQPSDQTTKHSRVPTVSDHRNNEFTTQPYSYGKKRTEQLQEEEEELQVERTIEKCKDTVSHLCKRIKFMAECRNPHEGRVRQYKEYLKSKQRSPESAHDRIQQKRAPRQQQPKEKSPLAEQSRTPKRTQRPEEENKVVADIQELDADIIRLTKLIGGIAKGQRSH